MAHSVLLISNVKLTLPSGFAIVDKTDSPLFKNDSPASDYCAAIISDSILNHEEILIWFQKISAKNPGITLILQGKKLNSTEAIKLINLFHGLKIVEDLNESLIIPFLPKLNSLEKLKLQEIYHVTITQLNRVFSISDIETCLLQNLSSQFDLEVVRLVFSPYLERFKEQLKYSNKSFAEFKDNSIDNLKTSLFFIFKNEEQNTSKNKKFLKKIADATFLSMLRILRIEHLENLERHWNSTFNSFDAAIAVVDKGGHLIKLNKKFDELIGSSSDHIIYIQSQIMQIKEGHNVKFSLNNFDLEATHFKHNEGSIVIIRDITESQKLERQILESSKMAELGMIGSSIAHEINNPLAGMLSYIQLIKMDLKPEHFLYSDIIEMESATLRCKTIVENLLGFARKPDLGSYTNIDLENVIKNGIELVSLSAKYKNVNIELNVKSLADVNGNSNNLVQAFKNILQNSIEAISDKTGLINITLESDSQNVFVIIEDNGIGIENTIHNKIFNPLFSTKNNEQHPGLGLTVAFQIFQDHNANLEIVSQPMVGTTAKISFKRLDLNA